MTIKVMIVDDSAVVRQVISQILNDSTDIEVYAMANLIMSVLFYLGLRWEQDMNHPRGHKWLILIAFVIGLSFGVHFMGLLTIPALGLIYFFKNY